MVYEGAIRPSHRNRERKPDRIADFIELPLPYDELDQLAETPVGLAITLSYFIDPTDNPTRGTYAGSRLRWDLQGPTEEPDGFRARINQLPGNKDITVAAAPASGKLARCPAPGARSSTTALRSPQARSPVRACSLCIR
jgi:hypothetical protein